MPEAFHSLATSPLWSSTTRHIDPIASPTRNATLPKSSTALYASSATPSPAPATPFRLPRRPRFPPYSLRRPSTQRDISCTLSTSDHYTVATMRRNPPCANLYALDWLLRRPRRSPHDLLCPQLHGRRRIRPLILHTSDHGYLQRILGEVGAAKRCAYSDD